MIEFTLRPRYVSVALGHLASVDPWGLATVLPCPACGAGRLLSAEAGYVPGYRICEGCGRPWIVHPCCDDDSVGVTIQVPEGPEGPHWTWNDVVDPEAYEAYCEQVCHFGGRPVEQALWVARQRLVRPLTEKTHQGGQEVLSLPRTGQAALRVCGQQIVQLDGSRSRTRDHNHYHDVTLYRTSGQLVLAIGYRSRYEGELPHDHVVVCADEAAVAAALQSWDATQHFRGFPESGSDQQRTRNERIRTDLRARFAAQASEVLAALGYEEEVT